MEAITIKAYPQDNSQIKALKAFMKALNIKFEVTESPYNPEFVEKIKKSQQDYKEGKGKVITIDELNTLWK
jgi:cytochrome c